MESTVLSLLGTVLSYFIFPLTNSFSICYAHNKSINLKRTNHG